MGLNFFPAQGETKLLRGSSAAHRTYKIVQKSRQMKTF
jgi:hypothetical protein